MHILRRLRGRTSGFAIPTYVLDTPHGKVPLNRSYVKGRAGDHVLMESYDGTLWAEPNPVPEDVDLPFRLPAVALPDGVDTIPTRTSAAAHAPPSVEE
jgi:lysine 2,3-aminomutase